MLFAERTQTSVNGMRHYEWRCYASDLFELTNIKTAIVTHANREIVFVSAVDCFHSSEHRFYEVQVLYHTSVNVYNDPPRGWHPLNVQQVYDRQQACRYGHFDASRRPRPAYSCRLMRAAVRAYSIIVRAIEYQVRSTNC